MKKFLAISIAFALTFGVTPSFAAAPKAGAACTKIGLKQVSSGREYRCVTKGSKKVWKKGFAAAVYSPKGYSGGRCESDPSVKGYATKLQEYLTSERRCIGAMKIVSASMPNQKPKSKLSPDSEMANPELCKIENSPNSNSWKGFPAASQVSNFNLKRHPSPKTVMQVVPIYSADAPAGKGSPSQDYKFYFDFIKKYFQYIDDTGGSFELRVPDRYLKFDNPIKPYGVKHGKDDDLSRKFIQDVITSVDSEFDFRQHNYTLVVVPAGTPSGVIGQQGFGRAISSEGEITNLVVAQPATVSGPNNSVTPEMSQPTMWLHEFYHPGLNLGDNHADDSRAYDDGRGMGDWGLMSRNNGDLLAWQKWILGFTSDSQIRCVNPKAEATLNWIAPSSVKTKSDKLVVVPISKSKAIVVESIRAVGLSYRYAKSSLGALVYLVDSSDPRHEWGYTVIYSDSRRPNSGYRYLMEDAPLKVGESVTLEGVKITNIEWGEFGDVIKVESVK
jgi:M6 family metalloprotease-like protein